VRLVAGEAVSDEKTSARREEAASV
jgi:hypothetical protein